MRDDDPIAAEVLARLRGLARLANLNASSRLESKVPMTPAAVSGRLRRQQALRRACRRLAAIGGSERS